MKIFLLVLTFTIFGFLSLPQNAEAEDSHNEYVLEYQEVTTFCPHIVYDADLTSPSPITECIPQWIKNTVGWWANGLTPDSEFIQSIHYLINKGIIVLPTLEFESKGQNIPQWLKTNVGWWADGKIDDSSFVLGIEYLVKIGIIDIVTNNLSHVIF